MRSMLASLAGFALLASPMIASAQAPAGPAATHAARTSTAARPAKASNKARAASVSGKSGKTAGKKIPNRNLPRLKTPRSSSRK